jgi:hypothetical protein
LVFVEDVDEVDEVEERGVISADRVESAGVAS